MLKQYDLAIAAFERVLIVDESSIRTKLEIAKCYFQLKKYKKSKKIFTEVLQNKLPSKVKENVNTYLQAINNKIKKHTLNGSVVLGIDYDSNIYNRANDGIFTIPGLVNTATNQPLQVTNSTKDESGLAHQEILVLNHLYKKEDNLHMKNDFILFSKVVFDHHDKDLLLFQYAPSLFIRHNNKVSIDYSLLYNKIWLNKKPLLVNMGLYPKFKYIYSKDILIGGGFKYQKKSNSYNSSKNKDSKIRLAELNVDHIFSKKISFSLYGNYYRERKIQGSLTNIDNDMLNLKLAMTYKYTPKLNISPKIQWYKKRYKEMDPFYLKNQKDSEYQLSLNSMYYHKSNVLINAAYSYTHHKSNIPSSEFNKQSIICNIILPF